MGTRIVAGGSEGVEEGWRRGIIRASKGRLEPQALTVEDGEEGEPEEHGIEFAARKANASRDESESGEGGAEEEVELVVVKGS